VEGGHRRRGKKRGRDGEESEKKGGEIKKRDEKG